MEITVEIKTVYGVQKIYPRCDKAKAFANLANTTTLTSQAIDAIKALGFSIAVYNPIVKL